MQLRAATPGEGPALAVLNGLVHELHVAQQPGIFRREPPLDEVASAFETWIAEDAWLVLVAEGDASLAGFLVGYWTEAAGHALVHEARILAIEQIAVVEEWRRQGIGSALVRGAVGMAAQRGVDRVELTVWRFNDQAREFFGALGFRALTERLSLDVT